VKSRRYFFSQLGALIGLVGIGSAPFIYFSWRVSLLSAACIVVAAALLTVDHWLDRRADESRDPEEGEE
jgi:4-hydroxybenzoate polyprenyltransferase